jgi:Uncharacterized protein predicted to be involved in DNA repair (RAMP superfamily)
MSKYLITLTPMGSYYFGGENSFSVGENDKNELASYIVKSNLFPQQTSLLGMLRFWVLRNSDAFNLSTNKITNHETAKSLIGEKSFCVNGKNDFKTIKNIGICFLQKKVGNDNYVSILPSPLDYKLTVNFENTTVGVYNGIEKKLPTIIYEEKDKDGKDIRYTDKEGLIKKYISPDGMFALDEGDIFIKDQRIGINRDIKTGKTDDKSLYKQVFYRLADGFRFAFIAEFKDEYKLPQSGQIVELGGDSSKFVLNVENLIENAAFYGEDVLSTPTGAFAKITLLSDTLLDNIVVDTNVMFSISEHIPFRFLSFKIDETQKYSRTSKNDKNKRYSLFKRGSVFYFGNESSLSNFTKAIGNNEDFKQIGYNQYEPNK